MIIGPVIHFEEMQHEFWSQEMLHQERTGMAWAFTWRRLRSFPKMMLWGNWLWLVRTQDERQKSKGWGLFAIVLTSDYLDYIYISHVHIIYVLYCFKFLGPSILHAWYHSHVLNFHLIFCLIYIAHTTATSIMHTSSFLSLFVRICDILVVGGP